MIPHTQNFAMQDEAAICQLIDRWAKAVRDEDLDAVRSTFPALKHALAAAMVREAFATTVARRERRLRNELREIRAWLQEVEISRVITFGRGRTS